MLLPLGYTPGPITHERVLLDLTNGLQTQVLQEVDGDGTLHRCGLAPKRCLSDLTSALAFLVLLDPLLDQVLDQRL